MPQRFVPAAPDKIARIREDLHAALTGLPGQFSGLFDVLSYARLLAFLVYGGAWLGRTAWTTFRESNVFPNLYGMAVGNRQQGRSHIESIQNFFGDLPPMKVVFGGVTNALSLLHSVRDAHERWEKEFTTPGAKPRFSPAVVDGGVPDKRLLVIQSCFAEQLMRKSAGARSLGGALIDAYYGYDTQVFTSFREGGFLHVSQPHIGLWSDVDRDSYGKNKVFNVCLFADASASPRLNHSGYHLIWRECCERLKNATGGYPLSGVAEQMIEEFVRRFVLKEDVFAVYILVKISLLYAIYNDSRIIVKEHAAAAIALFRHSLTIRRMLRGDTHREQLNKICDRIENALRTGPPEGLTGRQISRLFRGNVEGQLLNEAKQQLLAEGLASKTVMPTAGRPREQWVLIPDPNMKASFLPSGPLGIH